MEVVDLDAIEIKHAIEIKPEDIESYPEGPPEKILEFPLKTERSKTTSIHLKTPHYKISNCIGKDIGDDSEDGGGEGEFQYICNTGKDVQVLNFKGSDEENFRKGQLNNVAQETVQIGKPLHDLSGISNSEILDNEKSVKAGTELNLLNGNNENEEVNKHKYFFDRMIHGHELVMKAKGYECFYCSYLSSSSLHMKYHIRFNHRDPETRQYKRKVKQCPHCPKKSSHLGDHIYYCHTDPSDIKWVYCGHCDYKAKAKFMLVSHIKVNHTEVREDEFKECKECGKRFKSQKLLKRHTKCIHNPETMKQLKCDSCDYTTRSKYGMKRHMFVHKDPEGGLTCSKCEFHAQHFNDLIRHKRNEHAHWVQCHLCPYRCYYIGTLKKHLIHHQEKKKEEDLTHRCKKCDYKTYRTYNLKIHMLKHKKPEETEMFRCYHCDFKANRKDNLKTHIFKHEQYKLLLDCFICSFKTRSQYELKKHVDIHSDNQRKEEAEIIDNARTQVDGSKNKKEANRGKKRKSKK